MVDNKDLLILEALKENARASVVEVAKKTGLPSTTVHNRIKKLRKDGVIESYTIKVNNKKIGKEIAAYISIVVNYDSLKKSQLSQYDLGKKIKKLPFVEEVNIITGGVDIIVKVRVASMQELSDFVTKKLRNYDGVQKTSTVVILDEVRD